MLHNYGENTDDQCISEDNIELNNIVNNCHGIVTPTMWLAKQKQICLDHPWTVQQTVLKYTTEVFKKVTFHLQSCCLGPTLSCIFNYAHIIRYTRYSKYDQSRMLMHIMNVTDY